MINNQELIITLKEMQNYIIAEKYAGYDPHDCLNSPLFSLPLLKSNRFIRFSSQQIFRRVPLNLRPLFGIKKGVNPVTIGVAIQSYSNMIKIDSMQRDFYIVEINNLINKLLELSSKNYSGLSWGYNFDWEARYASIPKYVPTIVATGIITNSLFQYYLINKEKKIISIINNSAKFILRDLNRFYEKDTFCFSYSPNDRQKVINATMKGARLLAQAYILTGEKKYLMEAEKTVEFVIRHQNQDGSWPYAVADARNWTDNFHTAYVLDALDEFILISEMYVYKPNLIKGLDYYLKNLFTKEGFPKYYTKSFYPIDSTNVAQSIITLSRFGKYDNAKTIIQFALQNLYSGEGYFFYQRNKYFVNKTSFMRWSNIWFFLAFTYFLANKYND